MEYFYLKDYADKMQRVADACVDRALKGQSDGSYVIKVSNLEEEFKMKSLDDHLLMEMLSEREEISIKEYYEREAIVDIAPEYITNEGLTNLKTISHDDLRIKLAKHYLWLHDEYGGVQADLSGYYIEDFNFDNQDMCSVVMNGAKFVNCSFWHTSMCTSECVGTKFSNCNMMDITAEESNFDGAVFRYCSMQKGIYTHSNFNKAKLVQCEIDGISFQNACVADVEWIDTSLESARMDNSATDFEDWQSPDDVPGLNM